MFKNTIILFLSLFLLSCHNENTKKNYTESDLNKPDQTIVNIKVSFVDSVFTKAILQADSGFAYSKTQRTILRHNIIVDFYSAKNSGEKISTLTADSVVIEDDTKNMTAYGKVLVNSAANNTSLSTKILQWDNSTRKMYSSEYVKIVSPNEILEGYGFESDEKLSYYKIFKVKGIER